MPPRSTFRQRFGVYLLGVAIGCVLAGTILSARAREAARRQQEALSQPKQPLP